MIRVTVQTEKRLQAITDLSRAIRCVAEALSSNVSVTIRDNVINNAQTAVEIDAAEETTETKIWESDKKVDYDAIKAEQ